MQDIKKISIDLLAGLSDRQRETLKKRFGINGNKKMTLAAIGKEYGITRERVRQIESDALRLVNKKIKQGAAREVLGILEKYVKGQGGIVREDVLLNDTKVLLKDNSVSDGYLKFLFEASGKLSYRLEDNNFYSFWYADQQVLNKVKNFIDKTAKLFTSKKKELAKDKKHDAVLAESAKSLYLREKVAFNYISISKKFHINPYGEIGLSHWEEIKPKTVRSKAYLVMKKNKEPLHFRKISDLINEISFDGKAALPQTVHNELIKDPRFVLVGRGIYALKEFGFTPGTAREVIARTLKEEGPMNSKQLLGAVMEKRMLKENTILLNLQNKKYFKRLQDGKYYLIQEA